MVAMKEEMESQLGILKRKSTEIKEEFNRMANLINNKANEIESQTLEKIEKLGALIDNNKELDSNLANLDSEIQTLNQSIADTKKEIENLGQAKNQMVSKTTQLSTEIEELRNKKTSLEQQLDKLTNDLNTTNIQITEIGSKLVNVEQEHKEKVGVHISKAEEIESKNRRAEMKSRVLKHLLDTKYLVDPVYDIIKRIGQSGIDDAKKLSLSANAQESTVKQILSELHAKGIVNYDTGSGKFTILKKLEDLE